MFLLTISQALYLEGINSIHLKTVHKPSPSSQDEDLEFPSSIYWMVISMGYGSGLIVGLVIGHILTTSYHEWFVETFGMGKKAQEGEREIEKENLN